MRLSPLPLVVLCLFMGFTFWVMAGAEQSLLAFGAQLMSSPDTAQVVIDLYILAVLACIWMYQDAKRRGKGLGYLVPFFVLTAVFVSAGPLLYLVLRGGPETETGRL
ncbi:DUF2834 domain-containing protein [Marinobacter adhaerens]|jgi:hypothetical protein|uniref:DUF2834 domain-containing protein n=1 Tax=Marinobacter adhaerens TaxID=1033846 RepID=A0ABX8IIB9_9GAMM|nr:DUF2834 domain-containing protein [Marinobacter adhaerens]MBW4980309.1 DUF2834 domain-containing protein [Marinobacter adhaerens]QWV11297.1 DUF2834 domain-containing protein [Marinobacter adhaerens]